MSYITSFLSSALSKLTQPSAPELTDGSTQGPIHQLRHQLLHYGLASIHRTLEDLDEKQAARWSANDTDKDHQSFSSNTKHMDMIAEVLFAKGQEPSLKSWNWAIEMLDKSWDSYKDTSPNVEEERKVEDECPVYAKSVRSDCELMRKIAKIDDGNPTVATEQ
jgi:tRNA A37 N6-isopentenylltransferase MiaA